MKRNKWIAISVPLLIIIVTPIVAIYFLNNGNPYTKYLANKNVPVYLEEQGYTENDIVESHYVEPKHVINNDFYQGHYMVIFKDEPEVTYYYGITKKGKTVKQFCEKDILYSGGIIDTTTKNTKHSEKDCDKSL